DDLAEVHRLTGRRIFLVWDHAADHVGELARLMSYARQRRLPITVVTAERLNEWNMSCDRLEQYLADKFELRYLSETEITVLLSLLEVHRSLGPNLRNKTPDQRVEQFKMRAG